jgi:hypothetical protein
MISLVYVSSATRDFSAAELDALLITSRRNNSSDAITGMLVYRDGDFLQILEGPEAAVRATYARIARDPRHGRIMALDESRIETRAFGEWSMGFRQVAGSARPEGFIDFFNCRQALAELVQAGPDALQYLKSFREIA